eukprot:1546973-Lingulodinium_polyedra.AAC.1
MTNAFMCAAPESVEAVLARRLQPEHGVYFRQRRVNAVVSIETEEGEVHSMPGTGVLMGDKCAPSVFNDSFCEAVERAEAAVAAERQHERQADMKLP